MTAIEIKNYRSFSISNPVKMEIEEGITFILGPNNIGKSNLLKVFYELRKIVNTNTIRKDGNTNAVAITHSRFEQLVHQKSGVNYINLTISNGDKQNELKIWSTNQTSFRISGDSNSEGHLINKEEFGLVKNLFEKSMYVGCFRTPTFHSTASYFDIKIGTQFITEWNNWANGTIISKRTKIRDLISELKEIFDFNELEISVTTDNKNLIITTENGSFLLNELGGGIGHIILVLGNALISEPDFILIDEPENGLHPKMQQIFITALAAKAKLGLIATSHSIGLARSTADKIYSLVRNNSTNKIKLLPFGTDYSPSLTSSISEMSYSQFVELGGNHILIVEGRTDIKSFREILRKYNVEHHFIILDLGGSNMINLDSKEEIQEIMRLNAKSYSLIFDSEREAEDQELKQSFAQFKAMCEEIGFNVFATDWHSTDNYITQDAINLILGEHYPVLGHYESLESEERSNSNTKWPKNQNWKMFRAMTKNDLSGTGLDDFIKNKMIPNIDV